MKQLAYKLFAATRLDQLVWMQRRGTLAVIAYHGVCEDRLRNEPWMPSYFVTLSAFREQLDYLRRNARVIPLPEAVDLVQRGRIPDRAVCISFDDGYANVLGMAAPELKKRDLSATLFVATQYIETGEFYPFDRLRMIRHSRPGLILPDYKHLPLDTVLSEFADIWAEVKRSVTPDQRETLRPLTMTELRGCDRSVVDLGAHTHSHCIMTNETPQRCREEIVTSIEKLRRWTGAPATVFSYPNGEAGVMADEERQTMVDNGIIGAVTTEAGVNDAKTDPYLLRRFPVGLFHDHATFASEICGVRTAMLKLRATAQ